MSTGMTNLDEFFSEVRLDVPEVGLPFVRKALQDASRDFIKRTHIWKKIVIMSIQGGKNEYKVPLPENTFIQDIGYMGIKVKESSNPIRYSDRTRYKRTEQDLDDESPNWREQRSASHDFWRWGVKADRKTLFLYPEPVDNLSDGMKMQVILAPDQNAFEVPDIIFDEWAEAIGFGAAAKLLDIPGKSWTNIEAADMRKKQFNRAVAAALRKSTTEQPRVKFRGLGDMSQRYNRII